jgi:allophanate hydrolase
MRTNSMQNKLSGSTPAPTTITQWHDLATFGADWAERMMVLREKMELLSKPIFLAVRSAASLESNLHRLDALRKQSSVAELKNNYPLFGVPFVVKDNIDVLGMPTTAACPAFSYEPATNAWCVQRLIDAGAICLGKTNLDQFATGLVGTRSPHGSPSSVFDAQKVSGGSSSGSAVSVASGLVPFSLGTDTAGSGRVPAMFNHIVGLKPTVGRVSTQGVVPACASLDCVSIFALTVQDAAQVLTVIEGPNHADSFSMFTAGPERASSVQSERTDGATIKRERIGVPRTLPDTVSTDIAIAFDLKCTQLKEQGYELVPIDFSPLFEVADLLYNGPWVAERFLVIEKLLSRTPSMVDPIVAQVVERARNFTAADLFKAQYRLGELKQACTKFWNSVDIFLVPTAPCHPTHVELAHEPIRANSQLGLFTNFVNLLGWSALAIPAHMNSPTEPFGVTLIGPAHHDAVLLSMAHEWQIQWSQSPGLVKLSPETVAAPFVGKPRTRSTTQLIVVGAHLSGLPLNWQLTERAATFVRSAQTEAHYKLYALPGTTPPKPGLQRVTTGGCSIAVEVWQMPTEHLGSFLNLIPAPLGLGTIQLSDGTDAYGFLCEHFALHNATDISQYGGWRAYLNSIRPSID